MELSLLPSVPMNRFQLKRLFASDKPLLSDDLKMIQLPDIVPTVPQTDPQLFIQQSDRIGQTLKLYTVSQFHTGSTSGHYRHNKSDYDPELRLKQRSKCVTVSVNHRQRNKQQCIRQE